MDTNNRASYRSREALDTVAINDYQALCYRWQFTPMDAMAVYCSFLRNPYSLLSALVFRGDGVVYCDSEENERFESWLSFIEVAWKMEEIAWNATRREAS